MKAIAVCKKKKQNMKLRNLHLHNSKKKKAKKFSRLLPCSSWNVGMYTKINLIIPGYTLFCYSYPKLINETRKKLKISSYVCIQTMYLL